MMLCRIIFLSLIVSSTCLEDKDIDFSLNFFKIKDIKFICLLACENMNWNLKFAKKASNSSIAISSTIFNDNSNDLGSVSSCLNRNTAVGVVIDTNCAAFEDVLILASESCSFDDNHKWLIQDGEEWTTNVTGAEDMETYGRLSWLNDKLGKLNLSVDADVTLSLQKDGRRLLYDVYNFGKIRGGDVVVSELGESGDKSVLAELKRYKYYRRWDFEESTINLVAVISTPPAHFDIEMIIGNDAKKGIAIATVTCTRILEELKELHNIRFNYTILDRWIGDYKRNSTRVVANSLYFKEQDLTPILRINPEIFRKVDMLMPPLSSIETRYYYRIPTAGAGKFENQFLRPLTSGAWGCVAAVTALCAIVLFLAARAERRPSAAQFALFSVLATFCQQFFEDNIGSIDPRRESSGRQLAVLVTGTSCVLIYNYYTSSVVSWLLNGPPPSINSLEELLESPLTLIFQDMGYTRSWLQNPTYYFNKKNAEMEDKLRRYKVFNKKEGSPLFVPLEEGIEMVKAGGYAYHTEPYNANTLIAKTFTQEELCELGSLQSMAKTRLYASVPKNSPYKEFFNWNLLHLYETGVVSRSQRITRNPEISCGGSSPRALALGGAAPAFLLLAFGFLLSLVILLMERFHKRHYSVSVKSFTFLE